MLQLTNGRICMLAVVVAAQIPCSGHAQEPPSEVLSDALLRVQFETRDGLIAAPGDSVGSAFLLHLDSGTVVVVTAYHLFTAAGIADDSLAVQVRRVQVHAVGQAGVLWEAGETAAARSDLDIAAFRFASRAGITPLHLADRTPQTGETVWLMARLQGPCALMPLLHQAIVDTLADGLLTFRFRNQGLLLGNADTPPSERYRCFWRTSGSPVLDSAGELVGMAVGVGLTDADSLYGLAVRGETLRRCLPPNPRPDLSRADVSKEVVIVHMALIRARSPRRLAREWSLAGQVLIR